MRFARFKVISLADSCTTLRVTALLRSMSFGSRGSMHCRKGYSQLLIINYKLSIINYKLSTISIHFCLTASLAGVDEEQAEEEDDGEIAECRMLIDVVEHSIDEHRQAEHIHADESPLR